MSAKLHAVPSAADEPAPDMSYEARERRHILSRDWASVHVRGDRAPALSLFGLVRRTWR